ncbi:2-hydroxy-6-oxononadienedioate/2-hydroxy-6-oxononatrienedioate hydrolase [Burkholderiales bacterium]|nr:2-hydroxy-6-oxononadienedioate/2-hydroxy-6-oxononatrienedioate hydrolase [Burkholderiales bacterium]
MDQGDHDRPALLLLPGLLCDHASWAPVLPWLAPHARCHVPDYSSEASLGAMADRVIDEAPERFALAGHSMGGRVALEVLRRAPGRVLRLALLDTGYRSRPDGSAGDDERGRRLALLALARERGMRAMGREWMRAMVHPARLADTALVEAILDMIGRQTPERFAAQVDALLARPDVSALLRSIRVPTLVACGRDDAWSPLAQHEEIAALVPGSRLAVFDDCGHMAPMEQPRAVADALVAWLCSPAATSRERAWAN